MRDLLELPNNPSIFSSLCKVNAGVYYPFISVHEINGIINTCVNPFRQKIVTCTDIHTHEFLTEIGGLGFDLNISNQQQLSLPPYIPILDRRTRNIKNIPSELPVVGITLRDILKSSVILKAGQYQEQSNILFYDKTIKEKSFKKKEVILFLTGTDTLIEWMWYKRRDCSFFQTLAHMGFTAITGFNFSVIGGECPFSHALNLKKSLFSTYLLEQYGIQVIPHVYGLHYSHLDRWITWFIANPSIKLFCVNCQLQKKEDDKQQTIQGVKYLLMTVPYLSVILQGLSIKYLPQFDMFLNRIHFADKKPIKDAQANYKYDINNYRNLESFYCKNKSLDYLAINNMILRKDYLQNKREELRERLK